MWKESFSVPKSSFLLFPKKWAAYGVIKIQNGSAREILKQK